MKSNDKTFLILLILGSVLIGFVATYIFTRPAIFPGFNLSTKGQIGDTIGGITAPIFGLIGFILVFYSFKEQYKANQLQIDSLNQQKIDKELSDEYSLIENLLENTDTKIDLFEFTEQLPATQDKGFPSFTGKIEYAYVTYKGATGMIKFCRSLVKDYLNFYSNDNFNLQSIDYLTELYYILKHADYLKHKILSSKLDEYKKKMLHDRFLLLYKSKLLIAIEPLILKFDSLNVTNDIISEMKYLKSEIEREYISA